MGRENKSVLSNFVYGDRFERFWCKDCIYLKEVYGLLMESVFYAAIPNN
jgi:hypothetical protein